MQTIQAAQYATQYLIGCQNMLTEKRDLIKSSITAFEEEELELDREIARMR
jgi:hypothetical protein